MNDEHKQLYKEKYTQAKQKSKLRFWPDIIYEDLLVSFALFILVVGLATFIGVAGEPKADPSDSSYLPRPEWYFLFLFKFLAIYGQIPVLGKIEWIATAIIPGIAVGALFLLPFFDRSPHRHFSKRIQAISVMTVVVVTIVTLTMISEVPTAQSQGFYLAGLLQFLSGLVLPGLSLLALFLIPLVVKENNGPLLTWTTIVSSVLIVGLSIAVLAFAPPHEATEEVEIANSLSDQIVAGTDLYSVQCMECHGSEGEGGEIKGVEGLEGIILPPINNQDVMYTFTDDTLYNIIAFGQPDQGMPPFGKAFGGELSVSEMEHIVAFMRYTWDDRAEIPADALAASAIPMPGPDEVPSYEVHMAPLFKRYCLSCHRPGKEKSSQGYLMDSYENVMVSGDNAPNVIAGDLTSHLMRMVLHEDLGDIGGPMPPKKQLKPELIAVIERWIAAGAPNTAADAAAATLP